MVNRLFSAINLSQGSAETCARCGGIFDNDFTVNYHEILLRKNFKNRLRFDRIMASAFVAPLFWITLYTWFPAWAHTTQTAS